MVCILHTTNTYLDRQNMGRQQRQEDYLTAFDNILSRAKTVEADAILHTGNLFWTRSPDQWITDKCRAILREAQDFGIDVYLLYGERDLKNKELLESLEDDGLLSRLTPRWNRIGDIAVFAHDATTDDPESGFHYPPDDVSTRVAALYDDLESASRYSSIDSFESEVGWKLNAIFLGDQSQPVRKTANGVRVLSPGMPERIVGKSVIDADELPTPQVFQYDIIGADIEVTPHEIDARPVAGVRLELEADVAPAAVRSTIADRDIDGTATILEITGEKTDTSPSKADIEAIVAEHAAIVRTYDERTPIEDKSRGATDRPGNMSTNNSTDRSVIDHTGNTEIGFSRNLPGDTEPHPCRRVSDEDDNTGQQSVDDAEAQDRLIVFGHVGGEGEIVDRIARETADKEIDAYVYTGSNRAIPGGDTDTSASDKLVESFEELSRQAPVYVVPDETPPVWTADTDAYAPPASPETDSVSVPDAVNEIPFDGQVRVDQTALTRNPWLGDDGAILVTHQARPERWHGGHTAYLAGGHLVGRHDRSYLNVGFASFDPGVGRDLLYGQYFEITVGTNGTLDVSWCPLGVLNEVTCPDHEGYGRLYLIEGLECPFCAMERRADDEGVETPTTVYERAYLVASDDIPARRAHQVAYFDRNEVTRPDETTAGLFPAPANDGQSALDKRALAVGDLRGELMYFVDTTEVDEVWLTIHSLVSRGELYDARISTAFTRTARGDSRHLLLVAVPNYADIEDAYRVHQHLTTNHDLDDPTPLKPTLYSNLGIYSSNAGEWGLSRSTRYTVRSDEKPSEQRGLPLELEVEADRFPTDMQEWDQWLLWKPEPDGRKVPRAPWVTNDDSFVSAMDPANQTSFGTAAKHFEKRSDDGYGLAFTLTEDDPFVLLDYDDARDPNTGEIATTVRQHIDDAESYADVSTSGTGVHLLVRGELSADVAAIVADLPDHDFSLEVYDSDRYVVMTGDHLSVTPTRTTPAQGLIDHLQSQHATRRDRSDRASDRPTRSREELGSINETTDIEDVFDSIRNVQPEDIRLRSTVTETRTDGSKSLDPSWTTSESGTRLGQLDEIWIYRKGMYVLDALQVVALEERIISYPDEYPSDEEFWEAVAALRDRGAHIPRYTPVEESD